jgi:hypothetical protein
MTLNSKKQMEDYEDFMNYGIGRKGVRYVRTMDGEIIPVCDLFDGEYRRRLLQQQQDSDNWYLNHLNSQYEELAAHDRVRGCVKNTEIPGKFRTDDRLERVVFDEKGKDWTETGVKVQLPKGWTLEKWELPWPNQSVAALALKDECQKIIFAARVHDTWTAMTDEEIRDNEERGKRL